MTRRRHNPRTGRHKVKAHTWRDGVLVTNKYFFSALDEAIEFARELEADLIKIYDEFDVLVGEILPTKVDTYA